MKKYLRDDNLIELIQENGIALDKRVLEKGHGQAYLRYKTKVHAKQKRLIMKQIYCNKEWAETKSDHYFSKYTFSCNCVTCRYARMYIREESALKQKKLFDLKIRDYLLETFDKVS